MENKRGILIGICGLKRSGKDTMADYLCTYYAFTKYALADPLKKGAKELFKFLDEQVFGSLKELEDKRYGISPRELLQWLGTEVFQYLLYERFPQLEEKVPKRLFWVSLFKDWYIKETDYIQVVLDPNWKLNVVVSDIRFPHEAKAIKELGGVIVKIIRNNNTKDNHISENELKEIEPDYLIYNTKNKTNLFNDIEKIMEEIKNE